MNYLEAVICNYLIDTDISDMTTIEIAEHFYVSRALIYKVLNKMGYNSFTAFKLEKYKYQKTCSSKLEQLVFDTEENINNLVNSIYFANNIYVIGYNENKIVADYFTRQLVNLEFIAIHISDCKQIHSYLKLMQSNDLIIFISNSGTDIDDYNKMMNSKVEKYVIATIDSLLYKRGSNPIGIENQVSPLADIFERESIFETLNVIQRILFRIYAYKLSMKLSK